MRNKLLILGTAIALIAGYAFYSANTQQCSAGGGSIDCIHCESNCCDANGDCITCP